MQTDKVNVKFDKNSNGSYLLQVLLPNIILVILIAAFMWWVLRQTQSGNNQAISFGRSRARMIAGDKPDITFAGVSGVDERNAEVTETGEDLKEPEDVGAHCRHQLENESITTALREFQICVDGR